VEETAGAETERMEEMSVRKSCYNCKHHEKCNNVYFCGENKAYWELSDDAITDVLHDAERENDAVNHPNHYCKGNVECLDACKLCRLKRSDTMLDFSRTVFDAGIVCYNLNNFTRCIVLDGNKGTEIDRCSYVLEFAGDKLITHIPPNRALIPTGEFFDLKALKNFLTVSEYERKEVFEAGTEP
jgi:hypothetical protein